MPTEQYTGTLIRDLAATVERILIDPMDSVLIRAHRCPIEWFFVDAMTALSNEMVGSDEKVRDYARAWHYLADLRSCLVSGQTERCVRHNCGQMRGMHILEAGDELISVPGGRGCFQFLSADESYQAALKNFDAGVEDPAGC